MKRKKGYYSISVVAKMFSVHQQTIRMYEKEGLITPKRSTGNTRLFSEEDVDRLEEVIYLTHKLGVNLAGVEIILKLQRKVRTMQEEMNKMFKEAEGDFDKESTQIRDDMKRQIQRLAAIKQDNRDKKRENLIEVSGPAVDEDDDKPTSSKKRGAKQAKMSEDLQRRDVKLLPKSLAKNDNEDESVIDDIEIDYDKD